MNKWDWFNIPDSQAKKDKKITLELKDDHSLEVASISPLTYFSKQYS